MHYVLRILFLNALTVALIIIKPINSWFISEVPFIYEVTNPLENQFHVHQYTGYTRCMKSF
jgi:hypothetical protein